MDGSRNDNIALKNGTVKLMLFDVKGIECCMYLNNLLYVPSFNQNIFSVQATSEGRALIKFSQHSNSLALGNGVKFNIKKYGLIILFE